MKKEDYDFQDVKSIECEKDLGEQHYQCIITQNDGKTTNLRTREIIANGGDGMAVKSFKYKDGKFIENKDCVSTWMFVDSTNTLFCNLIHGGTLECESKDLLHF